MIESRMAIYLAPGQENVIYTDDVYHKWGHAIMNETSIAKLFKHGRSQAVRLPLVSVPFAGGSGAGAPCPRRHSA